jgi:hypothetical protein
VNSASTAVSIRWLTWAIVAAGASRVRWWYQAERAWWWVSEQSPGLRNGERDHSGAGGPGRLRRAERLIRADARETETKQSGEPFTHTPAQG